MARSEIAEKVQQLLIMTDNWSEIKVVYFLVQVRKLLDYIRSESNGSNSFRILRFYCDWIVHIRKDAIGPEMIAVLEDVEESIRNAIDGPMPGSNKVIDFAYFASLRSELFKLLASESLSTITPEQDDIWSSFIPNLTKILEDQPLKLKPNIKLNIKEVVFMRSEPNCAIIKFCFSKPIKGRDGRPYNFYEHRQFY